MRKIIAAFLFFTVSATALQAQVNYITARTTGKLPMLAYGLGQDRLGGAKLGYIDTNVLVKVIDSTKDMFRLRLSNEHTAYINKENLKPDTTQLKPFYLTNSWSVKGDEVYDYVTINMDEKLPYKSWMEINPARIMVELYGVQSNTNWITQLKSAKEIKEIYFSQKEDDVVSITIELKNKNHWGYSIYYQQKNLVVRVRRQPQALRVKKMKIAIDAGHGGANTGAVGVKSKTFEKDYTFRFAEELKKYLKRKGANVITTRQNDSDFLNIDRVLLLKQEMPQVLISLHLNSSSNPEVKGVSTYYKHIGFKPLNAAILNRLLELNLNEFGIVGNFNFALNQPTEFPSALVEVAFLSNEEDEVKILDPRFQKAVAKKIYRGIKDWLKAIRE